MARYNEKLNQEVSNKLCEALKKGHSIEAACAYAGITRQSFYNWISRGKKAKSGKYRQFLCSVDKAKDQATLNVEAVILDNIPDNPSDAKWWLTKRRQDIYGEKVYTESKVDANIRTEILTRLERPLPELEEEE